MPDSELTKRDWRLINAALALYEAETEDGRTQHLLAQVSATRTKVHDIMEALGVKDR